MSTSCSLDPAPLTLIVDNTTYLYGNSLEDLRQQLLSRAAALTALAGEEPPAAATAAKPKAERKAKEPQPEGPAPEIEAANENAAAPADNEAATAPTEPTTDDAADAPEVTYEDVRGAVTRLAGAKGRDAALGVLAGFGVDHASKLAEDQWAAAVAELTGALAA